ncbi:hypothetical protein Esti_003952 [Eimeria stiedai]
MERGVLPVFKDPDAFSDSACSPVEKQREENALCEALGLPAHLALNNNASSAQFGKPQEGFAVHAAFTEAAFSLLEEGRIDAAQIGALEKLFTSTLEEELASAIRFSAQMAGFSLEKKRGKRKACGGGSTSWTLKGCLSAYRRESHRIQIVVTRATLTTEGLVLLSDRLTMSSTDT